jgi:hypothetical protein
MAKVQVAVGEARTSSKIVNAVSVRHNVTQWVDADEMLKSVNLQPGDVAVVREKWAIANRESIKNRLFPSFVVLLDPTETPFSAATFTPKALEHMENGVVECLSPLASSEEIKGVVDFVLFDQWEVPRDKPTYRGLWTVLSLTFVALVFFMFGSLFHKKSPLSSMQEPHVERFYHGLTAAPSGIAIKGDRVWISDWYSQSISTYGLGDGLTLVRRFAFKEFSPRELAASDRGLWSLSHHRILRHHSLNPTFTVTEEIDLKMSSLAGLAWDGGKIWSCDTNAGEVVSIDVSKVEPQFEQFPIEVGNPIGLVVQGSRVWILDGETGDINFYQKRGGELVYQKTISLPSFKKESNQPSGFGGDGDTLWVTAEKSGLVYSMVP